MPRRLLLALAAGGALSLAFEPVGWPWLIPLALAARLLSLRGLRPRTALAPGACFGVGFFGLHVWWMHAVGLGAWLALVAALALFLTAQGALDAALLRGRWWPLWTAVSWVAVEWARSTWPFGGMPWGRLAFALAGTPLAPALPYVGTAGVAFALALASACVAALVVVPETRGRTAAGLVLLCLAMAVPVWRPWHGHVTGRIDIAAVQGDVPGDGDVLDNYRAITASHVALTERLATEVASGKRRQPSLVLWPENSTATNPITDPTTNSGIWSATRAIGVPVVVGGLPEAPDHEHVLNQGIVWDPVTGPGDRYTKHHPVPFGEYLPLRWLLGADNFDGLRVLDYDMVAGTRRTPLIVAGTRVADAICFDIAYDDVVDTQVRNGGRLVTVQTSNATFIGTAQVAQQFAITRVQAMTTGRYAVVASLDGLSGVIAPDGTVVATAPQRTRAVLDQEVSLISGTTPAVWLGTRPGQVAAGLMLARLACTPVMLWRRRKTRREY